MKPARQAFAVIVLLVLSVASHEFAEAGSGIDLGGYPSPALLTVEGGGLQVRAGDTLTAGDLNGDGIADLIVGARMADPGGRINAGEVYVIYGAAKLHGTIFLDDSFTGPRLRGGVAMDQFGDALAVGDFNGDGVADLAVAATWAAPLGRVDAGSVYLFPGRVGPFPSVDLASEKAPLSVLGAIPEDRIGGSIALADLDGDGFADLIIGAPRAGPPGRPLSGRVYIIRGRRGSLETVDLASAPGIPVIDGAKAGEEFGAALALGDVNHDGRADLLIGAPAASPLGRTGAGTVSVILGRAPLTSLDLATQPPDLTIMGATANDGLGASVAAGDLNGDGQDDLVLGAPDARRNSQTSAGAIYGVLWSANHPSSIDLAIDPVGMTVEGVNAFDRFGAAAGASDLDKDGKADLLAGGPLADPSSRPQAGMLIAVSGIRATGARLAASAADLSVFGAEDGEQAGSSLAVADLTGNGAPDLIIGSPKAESVMGIGAGRVYVVPGPFALNPTPTPTATQTGTPGPTGTPSVTTTPTVTATGSATPSPTARLSLRYLPVSIREWPGSSN